MARRNPVTDDGSGEDGFVRRWSRLKRADGQGTDEKVAEVELAALDEASEVALSEADADEEVAEEEVKELTAEDLPDIDSLEADSDFTPFMQAGVPERLKNLALRKLWRSDPILANVDGLNDYDEDFKLAMEVGTIFMDKARAAGAKFIGEHPDEPETEPETEEHAASSEEDVQPEESLRAGDTDSVDAADGHPKDPDIEDI